MDRDQPVVRHVRDCEPDHVEMREERQQRPVAAAPPGDQVPDRVRLDLGELADGVAHGVEREVLVTGRAVGAQERVEEIRKSHCRESKERLGFVRMTSVLQIAWHWRFERGGSLRRI
jgi:hypothetical protein